MRRLDTAGVEMVGRMMRRFRIPVLGVAIALLSSATTATAQTRQAVLDTTAGVIVMDLLADKAPNHVALFIKTAQSGGYDGTTFFRMIKYGIVQGGDPTTKDPAARAKYGTGGLNLLKPEINDEKQTRGAVSATLIPGKSDSAGTQFFIAVTDQPGIDGRYTIFARVVEGMLTVQKISEAAVDDAGLAVDRIVVNKVTIRDKPAETPEPFSTDPIEELARYRAVLDTSMGEITLSFTPDKAPNHVRNFLRL
ncbi:MAG TPA: peptidylprolyl isomerase, partial [Vicinamibacterales bacterium]|nr:peptidylprolyl isomerase [Vicinamibacterales bacterium]